MCITKYFDSQKQLNKLTLTQYLVSIYNVQCQYIHAHLYIVNFWLKWYKFYIHWTCVHIVLSHIIKSGLTIFIYSWCVLKFIFYILHLQLRCNKVNIYILHLHLACNNVHMYILHLQLACNKLYIYILHLQLACNKVYVYILHLQLACNKVYVNVLHLQLAWYEVQIQDGRPNKTRERKCRVLWTGEVTAPAVRHNQPTGQGLHHTAMYQLPQNEDGISRRWVAACRQTDKFSETTGFYTKKRCT